MQLKRRLIKLFIIELLQWVAMATPVFVTAAEFARVEEAYYDVEVYWLVVSSSIGSVLFVRLHKFCVNKQFNITNRIMT